MTLGIVLLYGPRRGVTLLIPRYSCAGTYPLDMSQYNNLFVSLPQLQGYLADKEQPSSLGLS